MVIYVGLERDIMILYEIQINLNHFSVILHISLHVIIRLTEIRRIGDLRYNVHFDICNNNRFPPCIKLHAFNTHMN